MIRLHRMHILSRLSWIDLSAHVCASVCVRACYHICLCMYVSTECKQLPVVHVSASVYVCVQNANSYLSCTCLPLCMCVCAECKQLPVVDRCVCTCLPLCMSLCVCVQNANSYLSWIDVSACVCLCVCLCVSVYRMQTATGRGSMCLHVSASVCLCVYRMQTATCRARVCLCVCLCVYVYVQNANSYLSWIDVSCGKQVSGFTTALGRLDVMCQNPATGIVHLGHSGGACVSVCITTM